eukprot:354682-Chlamydomonas_euryale.AAC.7
MTCLAAIVHALFGSCPAPRCGVHPDWRKRLPASYMGARHRPGPVDTPQVCFAPRKHARPRPGSDQLACIQIWPLGGERKKVHIRSPSPMTCQSCFLEKPLSAVSVQQRASSKWFATTHPSSGIHSEPRFQD